MAEARQRGSVYLQATIRLRYDDAAGATGGDATMLLARRGATLGSFARRRAPPKALHTTTTNSITMIL